MSTLQAYSYQIKAYESQGDWIHGDYIVLNQFYIPSENLQYHFHKQFLIIGNPQRENNVEYLKNNNLNKSVSYTDDGGDAIYNLKEIELEAEFVTNLKKYNELDKQRKKLFEELINYKN